MRINGTIAQATFKLVSDPVIVPSWCRVIAHCAALPIRALGPDQRAEHKCGEQTDKRVEEIADSQGVPMGWSSPFAICICRVIASISHVAASRSRAFRSSSFVAFATLLPQSSAKF